MIVLVAQQAVMMMTIKFFYFWGGAVCWDTDRTATAAPPFLNAISGGQIQLDILNEISQKITCTICVIWTLLDQSWIKVLFWGGGAVCRDTNRTATAAPPFLNALD